MGHPDHPDRRSAAADHELAGAASGPRPAAGTGPAPASGTDAAGRLRAADHSEVGADHAGGDNGSADPAERPQNSESGAGPDAKRPPGRAGWAGLLPRASAGLGRVGERLGGSLRATGADGASASTEDVAGSALARLTTLPVLLIMAWLLPGLPLLLAGDFVPVPMLLISAPLLVALVANGLRVVPSRWPRLFPGRPRDRGWASWFGLMATVAVAAGFAAWQLVEHSESVVVLRDQGTYLQTGYWLAQHGALPIPQALRAFGGPHAGLGFSSIGFFAHGTSVVPSLTSGLPMLLAGGFWAQGVPGAAALGPMLGGLAVLSFGGLTARLAGPQWAPGGAIVLGLTLPEQYASRSAVAEIALQIMVFGGLCLLIDALTVHSEPLIRAELIRAELPAEGWRRLVSAPFWSEWLMPERALAALAGLALGLGVLVSLDSLLYLLPAIPFAGLLLAARRPAAAPFCWGLVIGLAYGLADGYLLSRPFLDSVSHSMELAGVTALWLVALTGATVQLLRVPSARAWLRRMAARRLAPWVPLLGSLIAIAVLVGLAVRPYVQTVHGTPGAGLFHYLASLQQAQGLPVDPTRTYAEDTLYWVIWYLGLPAVLLGGFGVALLVRQCARAVLTWQDPAGAWRNWGLPLAIVAAGSAAVLWQPDIVPDQPWASRRLIVVVLPGLILCALWAAAWLTGHARERGARPVTASVAGLFCVAALVVPTAATTFGAGFTHTGRSGGLQPTAEGMAFRRTGADELSAVAQLCGSIRRDSSVVILDRLVAQRFTQVIRGMCGVPTAWMVGQPDSAVSSVIRAITAAGRHPVLLGSRPVQLAAFGGSPVKVLDLRTTQDAHGLTGPPTVPAPIHFVLWMLVPQSAAVGA